MLSRPQNEKELQKREAIGIIHASRFIRKYSNSNKSINFGVVCQIHGKIFQNAWPEIAGKYRIENLRISGSKHRPSHFSQIHKLIKEAEFELLEYLKNIDRARGLIFDMKDPTDEVISSIENVIKTAAWLHHTITYIHPFREGNGRTARLAANLILERYGLIGISIKIENENKDNYRQTLAQIDQHHDYEPLISLISEGIIERYNGVRVKYYDCK